MNTVKRNYGVLTDTSKTINEILGDRSITVTKELTKKYEMVFKTTFEKAIEKYKVGLKTYERLGMVYEKAQVLNNLAGAYLQLGKAEKALEHYQQALDSLRDIDDVDFRAQIEERISELRET